MKKTKMVWGIVALCAMLVAGQVAVQACDGGGGPHGPGPSGPEPTPTAPSGSY